MFIYTTSYLCILGGLPPILRLFIVVYHIRFIYSIIK
nr:MAG TPA: hypothetical protein [Caudoviricetes sp.]